MWKYDILSWSVCISETRRSGAKSRAGIHRGGRGGDTGRKGRGRDRRGGDTRCRRKRSNRPPGPCCRGCLRSPRPRCRNLVPARNSGKSMLQYISIQIHSIYSYIYLCICMYVCIYIYIYNSGKSMRWYISIQIHSIYSHTYEIQNIRDTEWLCRTRANSGIGHTYTHSHTQAYSTVPGGCIWPIYIP